MKFILDINNSTKQKFSKKSLLDIFKHTIELAEITCLEKKELELSVALVGEDEIKNLNKQYRKKNSATDVLSFCEHEKIQDFCCQNASACEKHLFLGELVLCPKYIEKNANEDGELFSNAFVCIMAHGILHLLGLGHGKKMFDLQKKVASDLIIK